MSIADQIKDLEKQKEEIEHRIRQLQKCEPSIAEAIEELEERLKVIELQVEKDTKAVMQMEKNREGVLREREEVERQITLMRGLRYTKLFGPTPIDF